MTSRLLDWDGLVNVRDLGGLPLDRGGTTHFGAIVRSDNARHLSDAGWEQLRRHGIRTLVDLRFEIERDEAEPPAGVEVVHVSLFGEHDPDEEARVDDLMRVESDAARAVALFYLDTLETRAARVATAVDAVAAAPAGGVLVHCFVGKDRTGIVCALLLDLAGVEPEAIVADYALTEGRVSSLVDDWIAGAETDAERLFRRRISGAPARAMREMLAGLEERYGGARAYLRAAGLDDHTLERAAARLR